MQLKNLSVLKECVQREFLKSFDEVLCDCDGVLWYMGKAVQGSSEGVAKLKGLGKKVRFVSNNSTQTADSLHNKLQRYQLNAEMGDFVFPTMAIVEYLKNINFQKELFVIGVEAMKSELRRAGFKIAPNSLKFIPETPVDILKETKDNPDIGAIIVDIDINLNYVNIAKAISYLQRDDVLLMFGATYTLVPYSKEMIIGPAPFQNIILSFTRKTPLQFAKPSCLFSNYVKKKFDIKNPSRVLFIGDMLEQDMKFATESGFKKLLVLSGHTNMEHLNNLENPSSCQPDFYVDNMGSLAKIIENLA